MAICFPINVKNTKMTPDPSQTPNLDFSRMFHELMAFTGPLRGMSEASDIPRKGPVEDPVRNYCHNKSLN